MLAHYGSHGDAFGRPDGAFPPKYLSLEQVQLRPRRQSSITSTRKSSRPQKLRIITSPVAPAYRPSSTTTRTKKTKSIRPKQEQPPSPAMSGYSYSSSDQGNYNYHAPYPTPGVPQYTQSQINTYYAQYQCYPPQPYHIIPDYYTQPVNVAQTAGYQQPVPSGYDVGSWQSHGDDLGMNTSQGPTRSSSRTKTWTCDIPSCTSSANFTRLADLQRHQSTVHGVGTPEYPCNVPRCNRVGDKGFTRRDHLVEHLRNFHHIDIPKRRPGERSAFPFGWPESGGGGMGDSHQQDDDEGVAGDEEITAHAGLHRQRVRMPGSESGIVRAASTPQQRSTTTSTRHRPTSITRGSIAKPPSRRGGRAGGRGRGGSSSAGIIRLSAFSSSSSSAALSSFSRTTTTTSLSRLDFHQEQGPLSSSIQVTNNLPSLLLLQQQQRHPLDLTNAELAAQDVLLGLGTTGSGNLFGSPAPDPETCSEPGDLF